MEDADQLIVAAASRALAPRSSVGQRKAVIDMEKLLRDDRRAERAITNRSVSAGRGKDRRDKWGMRSISD